ncbi:MAG TPA: glycosyltransferase [Candidatus Limnocylindrales bacterium]|nr:glycosyltransferase [Candidatus Limnocylindrales bacterium]
MNKPPLVSVIITTKNSESTIKSCLSSIKNQNYSNLEIILVDNNSTDHTSKIAQKYTKLIFNKGPERSAQRNFGAKKAKGKFLLFVDSDMELSKNVIKDCVEKYITNSHNAAGVVIPEKSFGNSFWAKCKALEREFYLGLDWIEAPRFFSKEIFEEIGGYDEKQTGTEDFDLPQRIKSRFKNRSILRIKSMIHHNEGDLALSYTLKKKYYYVKTARIYREKKSNKDYYKKQSSIIERYRVFFSNPRKLLKNPILGLGMLLMKTSEFAAGGLGYISSNK